MFFVGEGWQSFEAVEACEYPWLAMARTRSRKLKPRSTGSNCSSCYAKTITGGEVQLAINMQMLLAVKQLSNCLHIKSCKHTWIHRHTVPCKAAPQAGNEKSLYSCAHHCVIGVRIVKPGVQHGHQSTWASLCASTAVACTGPWGSTSPKSGPPLWTRGFQSRWRLCRVWATGGQTCSGRAGCQATSGGLPKAT